MQAIEIKDQEGIIGRWVPLEKFTISFFQAGSIDSQLTGIVEGELPKEFRKEGLEVVFSGQVYQNTTTPKPMLGGQKVYWLKLRKIQKK